MEETKHYNLAQLENQMSIWSELYFCVELDTLHLVPNKPITDLRMSFFIFCSIFGHGHGLYGLTQILPAWDFFWG